MLSTVTLDVHAAQASSMNNVARTFTGNSEGNKEVVHQVNHMRAIIRSDSSHSRSPLDGSSE
jgi:hypothetical protein